MAKNGHSKFFPPFPPKRWGQIWNGQKWSFQILSDDFSQKDGKFEMAKNGCSGTSNTSYAQLQTEGD